MDYGTALTIIATTLISIAIIAAVLRLIARFLILKVSGWDDFCVLGAVVTAAGMLISINLSKEVLIATKFMLIRTRCS